jgi:uncharacterized protein (TIGR02271 family)
MTSSDDTAPPKPREEVAEIELREERPRIETRRVEAGRVRLRKRIRAEQRTLDVPLMVDEAVVVERRPVQSRSGREVAEGEFSVPVFLERAGAGVRRRVYERVRVSVAAETVTEPVQTTVRKEELAQEWEPGGGRDAR